ncbi:MAG: protein-tyrosine-phosphatase [Flavobacteriales bacterium]|nr:protein-tyrosine-phosphatase [Flavobacteriales bacterium]
MSENLRENIKNRLEYSLIGDSRKAELQPLIDYIQNRINSDSGVNLNFICTHNSRRSQFSQIWATLAASHYSIEANCFSGGVEVTEFNERAIASLKRSGFDITKEGLVSPRYTIEIEGLQKPVLAYSKLVDAPINPGSNFAAIITCSHADENCPNIAGAEQRIAVRYNDPKEFDDTEKEEYMYDERSNEIATEMFYAFSKIK